MDHGRAWARHHSLFTAVVLLALAQSALAEEESADRPRRAVDAVVTPTLAPAEIAFEIPLPTRVGDVVDESEFKEAWGITLDFLPQGRKASQPPFIDTSKWEIGGFAGAVVYSSDFEAGVNYVLGLTTRVPVPGLGGLGFYAEAFISYVDRDLPFYYNRRAGTWYGAGIGVDYTLWRGTLGYIRPQVGVMYAYWNNVNSLDNGLGITVGLQIGLFWIRNNYQTSVTFMPQFQMQSSDYMIFLPIGFSVDF